MSEKYSVCPMMSIALKRTSSCLENQCAWWNHKTEKCSVIEKNSLTVENNFNQAKHHTCNNIGGKG